MESLIGTLTGRLISILGEEAFSLYVHGSVVLGDFRPGWSDIDILCLTKAPLSPCQARRLLHLRQELATEHNDPGFRLLEGGILSLEAFLDASSTQAVYWGTSGEHLAETYALDPFSRQVLLDSGRLVYGKEIRPALTPPAMADIHRAIAAHLQVTQRFGASPSPIIHGAGWLLDTARGLYTLHTGHISAKTTAGEWALREQLVPAPAVLERVLAIRRFPLLYADDADTLVWISSIGPAILSFASVLEAALTAFDPETNPEISFPGGTL